MLPVQTHRLIKNNLKRFTSLEAIARIISSSLHASLYQSTDAEQTENGAIIVLVFAVISPPIRILLKVTLLENHKYARLPKLYLGIYITENIFFTIFIKWLDVISQINEDFTK